MYKVVISMAKDTCNSQLPEHKSREARAVHRSGLTVALEYSCTGSEAVREPPLPWVDRANFPTGCSGSIECFYGRKKTNQIKNHGSVWQ